MLYRSILLGVAVFVPPLTWVAAIQESLAGGQPKVRPTPNRAPAIETTLRSVTSITPGREISFDVVVTDPDGDRVSLRLLNPLPGMIFQPIRDAASPAKTTVHWVVPEGYIDRPVLEFRASDSADGSLSAELQAALVRQTRLREGSRILTADVTGDGVLDVVAGALSADVGGTVNTGAVYVWAGSALVNGAPTATLTVPNAEVGDELGFTGDQGIHFVDLTGDGVLDIVVGAQLADVDATHNTGAIYVFEGGAALSGSVAPWSTLSVQSSGAGDQLGESGLLFEEVTGDGQVDIIAGSSLVDVNGVSNAGAIYLFAGGLTLGGTQQPTATLALGSPTIGDQLGVASGQGIRVADVNGDSINDIVAGAQFHDLNGIPNIGAIHVWVGGTGLLGSVEPDLTLTTDGVAGAGNAGDQLGFSNGQGIQIADVTGDGQPDIVAGAQVADHGGIPQSGAVYVWRGGTELLNSASPVAALRASSANSGDQLGNSSGQGVQLVDVTDDGVLDVVAGAQSADLGVQGSTPNGGAIYIWEGGAFLSGEMDPTLELYAGSASNDQVGFTSGQGIQLVDLTGDGRLELVATASFADAGGISDTGAIYVWSSDQLTDRVGSLAPSLTLSGGGNPGDQLGISAGQGVQFADVTGDGLFDLIAGAQFADQPGVTDTGRIFLWEGGPDFFSGGSSSSLDVSGAEAGDQLGNSEGQAIQFADVDADGVLDVVAGAQFANSSEVDAGAIYVWRSTGPGGLPGALPAGSPSDVLEIANPSPGDQLGSASDQGIQFADFTDDGVLDIIAGARFADINATNSGALFLWAGGATLSPVEDLTFELATPSTNDQLGYASRGFQLVDVTDDGIVDVVAGAQQADTAGVTNAGGIYLWTDHSRLFGPVSPTSELTVPSASAGDRLGQ